MKIVALLVCAVSLSLPSISLTLSTTYSTSRLSSTPSTLSIKPSGGDDNSTFHPDCADPYNIDIACTVHKVGCDIPLFDFVPIGMEPPEAYDVRVESFAKALQKGKHQLHVDISWQMPPKSTSSHLRAFKLVLAAEEEKICFVFNVTNYEMTDTNASPRFHFASESLFNFSTDYRITLISLPGSAKTSSEIIKTVTMPVDPEEDNDNDMSNMTVYCKTHSHPEASRWTAGFRRIFLQSISRTIQIEFVGAPAQFCFEEYEVRLLNDEGIELLHHTTIKASDMKQELIDGKLISFGEYNFTGLELDVDYIPSVIPIEVASDGRCLCPTNEQHGACSCIAADWKKVKLHRIEKSVPVNSTLPPIDKSQSSLWMWWSFVVVIAVFIALCASIFGIIYAYRNYHSRGKSVQIRFISDHMNNSIEPRAPLIMNSRTSVLLVYAHDCSQHEAAVLAFAELLRDTFGMKVHLDQWDQEDMERNMAEYINSSIVRAEKIIVINSMGAYFRTQARHMKEDLIERKYPGLHDAIFTAQIDLALQHARVVSVRFSYTSSHYTIPALNPLLQYTLPENLNLLVASLNESSLKNDPRIAGFNPDLARLNAAVSRMAHFINSEPKWFDQSHYRVPSIRSMPSTTLPTLSLQSPPIQSIIPTVIMDPIGLQRSSSPLQSTKTSSFSSSSSVPADPEEIKLLDMSTPKSVSPAQPIVEEMNCMNDDEPIDSAFYSGQSITYPSPHHNVLDKPRLERFDISDKLRESNNDSGIIDESSILISS